MKKRIFLQTGQVLFASKPCEVRTILGSCVSVCLHDPRAGHGAICHFKACKWMGKGKRDGRFAEIAIPRMVDTMLDTGSRRRDISAMVVGGGNVIEMSMDIGGENVEAALHILKAMEIRVRYSNVGGSSGRVLIYRPHEGVARIKKAGYAHAGSRTP